MLQTVPNGWGFPGGWLNGKDTTWQCRWYGFNLWVEKIPWRRKWQSTKYSCLGNPTDRGAWLLQSMGSKESDTTEQLIWTELRVEFHCQCKRYGFDPCVEKIPWSRKWQPTPVFLPGKSEEPGGLQSIWLQRVRHDWMNELNWTEETWRNFALSMGLMYTLNVSLLDKWCWA